MSSSLAPVHARPPDPRQAYERWHGQFDVDAAADAPWHRLVRRHLRASDLADRRVLEIACGRGGLAAWLNTQSPAAVVAADFAAAAVEQGREYARRAGARAIRWVIEDVGCIPHRTATFDTVISCETLEHLPQPRRALSELARVLKPGGRLFLTTPNYLGPMGLYRVYARLRGRRYTEEGQPINRVLLLPVTALWVARAGLRVQIVDAVGHYLPVPGRSPMRLDRLDAPRWLMRWVAHHSVIVAEKP